MYVYTVPRHPPLYVTQVLNRFLKRWVVVGHTYWWRVGYHFCKWWIVYSI